MASTWGTSWGSAWLATWDRVIAVLLPTDVTLRERLLTTLTVSTSNRIGLTESVRTNLTVRDFTK